MLEEDNVTVEYIGTMINRTKTTGSSYAEDIWGEVQSGGNMSFITEPKGAAKILTVSGITELPVTGYPGTSYLDGNSISWVVRGFRLTAGSDGKYSGKLKLGKFSSDPNYGDGTEDDTSGTGNFPSGGTITKHNPLMVTLWPVMQRLHTHLRMMRGIIRSGIRQLMSWISNTTSIIGDLMLLTSSFSSGDTTR